MAAVADDPLSPKNLRAIISGILTGNSKSPSAAKLVTLSNLLVRNRATWQLLSSLREATTAIKSTLAAIDHLQPCLLALIPAMDTVQLVFDDFNSIMQRHAPDLGGLTTEKITFKADRLITAAREARAEIPDPDGVIFRRASRYEDQFNSYAMKTADEFIKAMEAANPGIIIGRASNDGPLPRFLAVIAPLVSGEVVPKLAVKARLQKSSRENTARQIP